MNGVIDKIIGDIALVEFDCCNTIPLPRSYLPAVAKEGDVITQRDGKYVIDLKETKWLNDAVQKCYQAAAHRALRKSLPEEKYIKQAGQGNTNS